ncbi:MAG TPA: amidase [Hyphomonas sp.]|nr:amidase [Hyphomonas sp.]HRJ00150.1 amidase [Hyphomonas sp.]
MDLRFAAALSALALTACATAVVDDGAPPVSFEAEGLIAGPMTGVIEALARVETTSVELTQVYLDRIAAIDKAGPKLQAVIAINPDALAQAAASDVRRARAEILGPLDGVPVLLKDNIESLDPMPTTAGSLALKDNITGRDSPLVARLRAEGAVILGKTNLSEWANFRSNHSMSGWSGVGGQTRNPHMLDRNPCGSSSGTGSAIAASLAAAGVGTETNGSIICPSNVNGLVGFKPTVGLIPQTYIVPISPSQDTAGPMTKTVQDAALMMNAMVAGDEDFAKHLSGAALKGVRIGVLRDAQGTNPDIHERFDAALRVMTQLGATLVDIEGQATPPAFWGEALAVLEYEFKASLDAYLAQAAPGVTARSLSDVIVFNTHHAEEELALFGQDLLESSEAKGPLTDEAYLTSLANIQRATREDGIDRLLAEFGVDVLVAPSGPVSPRIDPVNGDTWPEWAGAGYLAAVAGYPVLSVPMGNVHGIPVGVSFTGAKGTDARLLSYGHAYETATELRPEPGYLPSAEDRPEIAVAMQR